MTRIRILAIALLAATPGSERYATAKREREAAQLLAATATKGSTP